MTNREEEIGKRIEMIRKDRGMRRTDLAKAIGVSKSAIFRYEHGHTQLGFEQLERLADALNCRLRDLIAPLDAALPRMRFHGPVETALPEEIATTRG
jgi:transcriptional regulator with XRE-family HTH domain